MNINAQDQDLTIDKGFENALRTTVKGFVAFAIRTRYLSPPKTAAASIDKIREALNHKS